MAFGVKTNEGARPGVHEPGERPGTRAQVKFVRMSAYKARVVLDLIRGKDIATADEVLRFSERDAAIVIRKCLGSAVANAQHNDGLDGDELYVSACFADEGPTAKRWRPRARGRAGRIRKRTCHVTVIVSRLPEDQLTRLRAKQAAEQAARRGRRVAGSRGERTRRGGGETAPAIADADADEKGKGE